MYPFTSLCPSGNLFFVYISSDGRVECVIYEIYILQGKSTVAGAHQSFCILSSLPAAMYFSTTVGIISGTSTRTGIVVHHQAFLSPKLRFRGIYFHKNVN